MIAGRLLLVDDDEAFRLTSSALLRLDGHEVTTAPSAADAARLLATQTFDAMLLDLRMPDQDGFALLDILRRRGNDTPVLVISGYGTVQSTVEALHGGADDVLCKPVDPDVLSARVALLLARRPRIAAEDRWDASFRLVGRSAAIRQLDESIRLVAPTMATVLITGETGTGKELTARSVHDRSPRRSAPFVALNCASLSDGVLESELFGHVRGAFTGAVRDRDGVFAAARAGTLFLDEVGDMSAAMQHRLLRAIQERVVTPVGSHHAVEVDVRIVAATNRDLRADVASGRFREDLFYRLHVFPLRVPALRERRTDIPLLAAHFLGDASGGAQQCSPLAMRMLQAYAWPGNVRELMAVLQSACIRAGGGVIDAHHLPPEVRSAELAQTPAVEERPRYHGDLPAEDERAAILDALERAGGVRAKAADLLGMGRTTLWRKMRQLELDIGAEKGGGAP